MINETDLPTWVAWLAQDADGVWWGFEHEPNQHHAGWYENELGRYLRLQQEAPNALWQHSLCRRGWLWCRAVPRLA